MRNKLILLILMISIILSGCINTGTETTSGVNTNAIPEKVVKAHYVDQNTILNAEDFPDFKKIDNVYYVAPENLSLTLETEMGHGVYEIDANTTNMQGYRVYGSSETYNYDTRYLLLQYKVFDTNQDLNETINMTAEDVYIKQGYKYVNIDKSYNNRVVVLESKVTNHTDMNVTIILFGFDTVIGKVGVQDYSGKSLGESLKILDIVFDRLKVKTKDVKAAKLSAIRSVGNVSDHRSNITINDTTENNVSSNMSKNNTNSNVSRNNVSSNVSRNNTDK